MEQQCITSGSKTTRKKRARLTPNVKVIKDMKPELTNKLEKLLWQQVLKRVLVAFSVVLLFIITLAYLVPLETKSYDGHIVSRPIPSNYSIIAELLRLVPTQNNMQHRTFLPSRLRSPFLFLPGLTQAAWRGYCPQPGSLPS